MPADSFLVRARARTEQRMTDTCTVRRETGTAYDDDTGITTPTIVTIYDGPCRLKKPSPAASSATVGAAPVLLVQPELHLPMAAALLRPQDEVTLTASVSDPASAGRKFRVRAVPAHTQATARRYEVVERT